MIAMRVGDENMRHGFVAHGVKQHSDMSRIVWAGIDDRNFTAAEYVAQRSLEGERTGIVGHNSPYARHRLVDDVRRKRKIFVKGNVVAHLSNDPNGGNRPTTISAILAPSRRQMIDVRRALIPAL